MKYNSARSLYNHIYKKYHDNREKSSNDVTELPTVMEFLGDLKGKEVLDMGCGLGKHAKEFMKKGGIVTGYDVSEQMVKLTKEYCQGKGTFLIGSHETISFEPSSFDVCNASFTLNYSKDLEIVFQKVAKWLKTDGIFTFAIPHPVWLLNRVEKMDYSKSHKIWIRINTYDIEVFNYYYPLDTFIQLINSNNFKLFNLKETTIPRKLKNWPEEKHRLPNALVFKCQKI